MCIWLGCATEQPQQLLIMQRTSEDEKDNKLQSQTSVDLITVKILFLNEEEEKALREREREESGAVQRSER